MGLCSACWSIVFLQHSSIPETPLGRMAPASESSSFEVVGFSKETYALKVIPVDRVPSVTHPLNQPSFEHCSELLFSRNI